MTQSLVVSQSLPPALAGLAHEAREYISQSKSANTKRAYRFAWQDFSRWCGKHGLAPLPASPETISLYVSDLAKRGQRVATISKKVAAISQAHQFAGHESPTRSAIVRLTLQGVRRSLGIAQVGKEPLLTADIRAAIAGLPAGKRGLRDRALLLLGFSGAFRRSELVSLRVSDLAFVPEGVTVTLRRCKTDQEGEGRKVGIPYGSHKETCPVTALRAWVGAAGIEEGRVFRAVNRAGVVGESLSTEGVARIVKKCARRIGLDERRFGAHSLRAGMVTQAALHGGAGDRSIQNVTGHRTTAMLRRYVRAGSVFQENAAKHLGL